MNCKKVLQTKFFNKKVKTQQKQNKKATLKIIYTTKTTERID